MKWIVVALLLGLCVPATSNRPTACKANTMYTKDNGCSGFSKVSNMDACVELCNADASPKPSKCPAPAGGCRYAIYNPSGRWCNLAGDECVFRYGGKTNLVDTKPPIDGGYSDFGDWSECSAGCDGGTQTRTRTCSNPAPANGGADCDGDAVESRECNTHACVNEYQVTIQTSSISYAGTNSAFYYTFVGSEGVTSEYKADAPGDDREPGHVNTWIFTDATDIGQFQCLRIRMDGKDGWHFEEVSVVINNVAQPTIANTVGWFDNYVTEDLCTPVYDGDAEESSVNEYSVTIQTSSISYAGTNSAFYYTFVGSEGLTSEYKADAAGDDREPGHVNTWIFTDATDIGQFQCLRIRMDGKDAWHFEEISIAINGVEQPTIANPFGWFDNYVTQDLCLPGFEGQ